MTDTAAITVRHNPDAACYELLVGDAVVGEARYRPFEDPTGPQRIFHRTVVDEAYGGRGLGSRLAAFALEDTTVTGFRVVPVCSYVSAFLERHPEYADNVVEVRDEHLATLR